MAVSSSQSISTKRISADKYLDEKNDITSPCFATFNVDEPEAPRRNVGDVAVCGPTHGANEGGRAAASEVFTQHVKNKNLRKKERNGKNLDFDISVDINHGTRENHHHSYQAHYSGLGEVSRDVQILGEGIASSSALPMQEPPSSQHNILTVVTEQGAINILSTPGIGEVMDKLESSAENDLQAKASMHADHDDIHTRQQHEDIPSQGKNDFAENCFTTQIDEVVKENLLNELSSQDSVGSCNDKRLVYRVRKKRSLDQQLTVVSKRLKQPMRGDPGSASFIKQKSSFMSWISNMIKGYPVCNQDEKSSPMLTNSKLECRNRKLVARYHEIPDTGFKNVFQSLYCSNNSGDGRGNTFQSKEGSDDAKGHSKIVDMTAVPLTICQTSGNSMEQYHPSYGICDQTASDIVRGSPTKQEMTLATNIPERDSKSLTGRNTIWKNVANGKALANRTSSNHISEDKATHGVCKKSDLYRSLWIARFCPKHSEPISNTDHHITKMLDSTDDCGYSAKGPTDFVKNELSADDPINAPSEGIYGIANAEASIGSKQVIVTNEEKPENSVEAMASVFARRLDALKQIIPYNVTDTTAPATDTCLFCGARGHDLQACPEVPQTELEELQEKIYSYGRVEESPCFCIKCFQLCHWAINCPKELSRKPVHTPTVDRSNAVDKWEKDLIDNNNHPAGILALDGTPGGHFGANMVAVQASNLNQVTVITKNPVDVESCRQEAAETSSPPLSGMARQGLFDSLRRLRLSRTDFLRLTNSRISLIHLGGFYLRVRLSKFEQGLSRKGYYVACINGAPIEPTGSRTRVSVSIGSFKCLVESQYISNQDFHEDELMAWWSATANGVHSRLPSEDELQQKYEERKRLGF